MPRLSHLSHLLAVVSGVIVRSNAFSSEYDRGNSPIDTLDCLHAETESFQEHYLLPQQNSISGRANLEFSEPGFELGRACSELNDWIDPSAPGPYDDDESSSLKTWDASFLTFENGISCPGDDFHATEKMRQRKRDMCLQNSQEREKTIEAEPRLPNLFNLPQEQVSPGSLMIPWDDSPCYPPYIDHLCCAGPMTRLDWQSPFYDDVGGCSPCSFFLSSYCIFFIFCVNS